MKLLAIQRRMAQDVMLPLAESGRPVRGAYLRSGESLASAERLEIYNRQYWRRLLDSLAEDFPGLRAVVGEGAFEAYLTECPSRSYTLRDLGSRLYGWLESNPRAAGRYPGLALDLARLEWAYIEAFDAEALREIGPEDLAEPNPRLRIALQPFVRPLRLSYPADEVRAAADAGRRVPAARIARKGESRIFAAVYRSEGDVSCRRVDAEEFAVLQCFARGGRLAEVLSRSVEATALPLREFGLKIQEWLGVWSELGWLGSLPPRVRKGHRK